MEQFLISIITANPKNDVLKSRFYVLENDVVKEYLSLNEFCDDQKTIVSFDLNSLINYQQINFGIIPKNIIDIEQLGKQIEGKPEKSFRGKLPSWNIWNAIKSYYDEESLHELTTLEKIYFSIDYSQFDSIKILCEKFLKFFKEAYSKNINLLTDKDEHTRFFSIEKKIAQITLHRSYHGIAIKNSYLARFIRDLSEEVYSYRNKLQLEYSIFSSNDIKINKQVISERVDIRDLDEKISERGFYSFLKTYKSKDPLINLLYQEKKASRNLSVLLSIGALSNKFVYPSYDSFGTVTSRTKMSSPNFQILSKKYRSLIAPFKGKCLVYIDYCQFEASILAQQSNDQKLIKFCNESDVYNEISSLIGIASVIKEPDDQRKFSKILFFKYSYGMDIKNHQTLLHDFGLANFSSTLSPQIEKVFSEFTELEAFRQSITSEAKAKGFVCTNLGNYRYKDDNDHRASWALSQRIQGTASLILKKAIISVVESYPEVDFLIPMHDAALFQVDIKLKDKMMANIKRCFIEAFQGECPQIVPKVAIKNFHE